jgi:UDP:flavonoid glycosyltransferase YjiC (YdhE family)
VIHLGGAGTTSGARRAGVPTLAASFIADLLFWGRRIAALSCGPGPIPFRKLTVERLAQPMRALVDTPAYREGAAAIGARLRAEDGCALAAAALRV